MPRRIGLPSAAATRVVVSGVLRPLDPGRAQGLEAGHQACACGEHLAGRRRRPGSQRVAEPDLEAIDAELRRDVVDEGLAGDRGLGHAETAEGTADRAVRIDRPGRRPNGRHLVRPRGMHRDAVGDRRAPGGVRAGIEIAVERQGREPAVGVRTERRGHARRVPLGRRAHRLRAGVDAADRAVEKPRGHRDHRLEGQVELPAEAAAASGRDHAHPVRREPEDQRDLVAVHVWRLGRRNDLDPVAVASRITGLRFDVGMLEVTRLERPGRHDRGGGQPRVHVSAHDPAARQDVAGKRVVELGRAGGRGDRRVEDRLQRHPVDREVAIIDAPDRLGVADQGRDRLAAEPDVPVCEDRLVLACRIDPVEVLAGHVPGHEHPHEPRVGGMKRREVADREARVGMGRPNRPQM